MFDPSSFADPTPRAHGFKRCTSKGRNITEYIEKLQERMEEMHHLARERIGMASEKMKTRYDARKQPGTTSTKATKCVYGIRNVAKDSLRSCRPTGKVLTQS
ncbi:hypothetical protein TNCV_3608901 [Trichonephila clavipes]|nr:hypothetical protein TNCV_3608901 [Trichonephila clavipes]